MKWGTAVALEDCGRPTLIDTETKPMEVIDLPKASSWHDGAIAVGGAFLQRLMAGR